MRNQNKNILITVKKKTIKFQFLRLLNNQILNLIKILFFANRPLGDIICVHTDAIFYITELHKSVPYCSVKYNAFARLLQNGCKQETRHIVVQSQSLHI